MLRLIRRRSVTQKDVVNTKAIVTITAVVVALYTTQHLVEARRGMEASKLRNAAKTKEALEIMKQDNKAANMEVNKNIEAMTLELRRIRTT